MLKLKVEKFMLETNVCTLTKHGEDGN